MVQLYTQLGQTIILNKAFPGRLWVFVVTDKIDLQSFKETVLWFNVHYQ